MKTELTGVPETMLWTLHNRASEARRADGIIRDPECLRIYDAIDYDYERSFGRATASHGVRSHAFDAQVRAFARQHPGGWVINLAEGLETQRYRLADLDLTWLSVDLPEAIDVREKFIEPDDKHRHVRGSALDEAWMEEVPEGVPVHLTAQGLLMYLPTDLIEPWLTKLAARFPGGWFSFDTIPPWFSNKTMKGFDLTPHYRTPEMPFGVTRKELPKMIERAVPGAQVEEFMWRAPRGPERLLAPLFYTLPVVRNHAPAMWTARFPRSAGASPT